MSLDDQIRRRDAMIDAVEAQGDGPSLGTVVSRFYKVDGIDIETLFRDLEQIRPLVADPLEERVLDVMDLVVGYCRDDIRIGPYAWGDPRNVFYQRNLAGKPLEGPD